MNTSHKQDRRSVGREKSSGLSTFKKFTVVAAVGIAAAVSVMSASSNSKMAYITDGEETFTVTTSSSDTFDIIEKAGIRLGLGDEAVVTEESSERIDINIVRAFPVRVLSDGGTTLVDVTGGTVSDALELAGVEVTANDFVTPSVSEELENNMEISVVRGVKMYLDFAEKREMIYVPEGKVGAALEFAGCELSELDDSEIDLDAFVEEGMTVNVNKVMKRTTVADEKIRPTIVEEMTDALPLGETRVKQEGKDGTVEVTYKEKYINGVLEEKEEISREVIIKPVDRIVLVGTKIQEAKTAEIESGMKIDSENGVFADFGTSSPKDPEASAADREVSEDNVSSQPESSVNSVAGYTYSKIIVGTCTAYTELDGITATGTLPKVGTVAVDPNVIPYGTRLYICSADGSFVYGYAVAEDTGTACMAGDIIVDLYMESEEACEAFGRQELMIYVLD